MGSTAQHRVGRTEAGRLPYELDRVRQRFDQPLDLVGEMAGHDDDPLTEAELVQEGHDDGAPVDREDGLRPAVGQRPQPRPLAGGHDDCFYCVSLSTSSRIAAATACLDALATT